MLVEVLELEPLPCVLLLLEAFEPVWLPADVPELSLEPSTGELSAEDCAGALVLLLDVSLDPLKRLL